MKRRINNGNSHLLSEGRPYVLTVWLGLFVAGLLILNGYMPSVAQDGSVQFILCAATGSTSPSDSTAQDSTDRRAFAMSHGNDIQSAELNPLDVRSAEQQHSAVNHRATTTPTYVHLARGPPAVS